MTSQGAPAPLVGIVLGSDSDLEHMKPCFDVLEEFEVPYELRIVSAHRTPEVAHEYARTASTRGLAVLISAAGKAAHLGGVMASLTPLPVIGVPMKTSDLGGMDSLLSTVQMPRGVPVATVAIGSSGAMNAGILAVQILATADENLRERIVAYKAKMAEMVAEKDAKHRK